MSTNSGYDREVRFEIMEHIGVLSTHSTGWNKELNLVSWNGGQPKYDIRDWDMAHEHMSRGVTLHEKEMRQIFELMKKRRIENRFRREPSERSAAAEESAEPTQMTAAETLEGESSYAEDAGEAFRTQEHANGF